MELGKLSTLSETFLCFVAANLSATFRGVRRSYTFAPEAEFSSVWSSGCDMRKTKSSAQSLPQRAGREDSNYRVQPCSLLFSGTKGKHTETLKDITFNPLTYPSITGMEFCNTCLKSPS